MALIRCPECGTEVSDKAMACPKCAYPIPQMFIPDYICPKCNTECSSREEVCPKCGYKIAKGDMLYQCPKCGGTEVGFFWGLEDAGGGGEVFCEKCLLPVYLPLDNPNIGLQYKNIREEYLSFRRAMKTARGSVHCPYCNSTLVMPAGFWKHQDDARNRRQWHCNNCGSNF